MDKRQGEGQGHYYQKRKNGVKRRKEKCRKNKRKKGIMSVQQKAGTPISKRKEWSLGEWRALTRERKRAERSVTWVRCKTEVSKVITSVSHTLPAIIGRGHCSQSHTILFSVLQPSPIDKSKTKVTAVFAQPLAQITSSKLWPAECNTLSLRVNDLAGCRPTKRGETETTRGSEVR